MDKNQQFIVITGATGFIGGHLLSALLNKGYSLIGITRDNLAPDLKEHRNLKWINWEEFSDHRDTLNLKILCVIHLATDYGRKKIEPSKVLYSNFQQPAALFSAAISMGAKKIIFADTFYGKPQFNYPHLNEYTSSKKKLLDWCIKKSKCCDTSFLNARFEHVFGPNDNKDKFIPQIIYKLKNLQTPIKLTSGNQKRDFIYIHDLIAALMALIKKPNTKKFEEYEIGNGYSVSLQEMLETLLETYDTDSSILEFGVIETRPKEIMDSFANIKPLNKLGWKPKWDLKSAFLDMKIKEDKNFLK